MRDFPRSEYDSQSRSSSSDVASCFSHLTTGLNQIATQSLNAVVDYFGSVANFISNVMTWIRSEFQGPALVQIRMGSRGNDPAARIT